MQNERRWCVHFKSITFLKWLQGSSPPLVKLLRSSVLHRVFKRVSGMTLRKFLLKVLLCSSICRTITVRCRHCVTDCECHSHASCYFGYAQWLSCSQRGFLQHLAKSCPVEVLWRRQTCAPSQNSLFSPSYKTTERPGESEEELGFAKLAFKSFLFPELHC